jgi:hypothetical protein
MPGQPEVTNSPNHFAGWRSSNDPLTRDLLDMGGATFGVNGRCASAARWERSSALASRQRNKDDTRTTDSAWSFWR